MAGCVYPSFEGTEKKVELVVDSALPSFRDRGDAYWHGIVERAGAAVLDKISNSRSDAYLLSESSLFVRDHRIVMMTCGRTLLHDAVLAVLDETPLDAVRTLFYKRRNETFPHDQPTSFLQDASHLNDRLPGRAYQFGRGDEHHLSVFHVDRGAGRDDRDSTIEVLMYGLDPDACEIFSRTAKRSAAAVRKATGLDRILPDFEVSDHLFEPAGYSLNAIDGDEYFAVHVTPEPAGSYASFETTHCCDAVLDAAIERLLALFRPQSYDLVCFDRGEVWAPVGAYRLRSHVVGDLDGDHLVRFMSFYRPQRRPQQAMDLPLPRRRRAALRA